MADTKLYALPDLTPAPYSEVQGLVRRLIEYADWSVLPALVDELTAMGRHQELFWLRHSVSTRLQPSIFDNDDWSWWGQTLTELFLFDLFSVPGVATHFGAVKWLTKEQIAERNKLTRWGTAVGASTRTIREAVREQQQRIIDAANGHVAPERFYYAPETNRE